MIKLYSTGCPRCGVLKRKLDEAKVAYTVIDDVDEMLKLGLRTAPALEVDGKLMDFTEAIRYVGSREGAI